MFKKINIRNLLYIIFGSMLMALLYNSFSAIGIDLVGNKKEYKTLNSAKKDSTVNEISLITPALFYSWYETKSIKIIDARDQWDFAEGHIKGAINIPEYSFEKNNISDFEIMPDDSLVIYCSANDCDISKRLAEELLLLKFKNLFVFEEGYEYWIKARLPTEKSEAR